MAADIPAELRQFISEHIGSVAQLELLLLLAAEPDKNLTAEAAAKALYVAPEAARGFLEGMCARGLCAPAETAADGYRFAPRRPEWGPLVAQLGQLYKERRLTVTELIYAGPVEKYRNFADAFRFRREK